MKRQLRQSASRNDNASHPDRTLTVIETAHERPREEPVTAKQKLLACLVLGLIAVGLVALLDKSFGHSGAIVIGLLVGLLFFVICVAVVK